VRWLRTTLPTPPATVRRSRTTLARPPATVRRSRTTLPRSPATVGRSSSILPRSPATVGRSSSILPRSPATMRWLRTTWARPPATVRRLRTTWPRKSKIQRSRRLYVVKIRECLCAVLVASCGSTQSATPDRKSCSPSFEGGSALDAAAPPDSSDVAGCSVPGAVVSYRHTTTSDTSAGPLPAIVYNHGSESLPGPKCPIANYFVPLGYVVFVPHRRGQGRSTGQYIGTYTAASQISYLQDQVADVTDAWNYVQALSSANGTMLVDPKRMAIMGHSYGGIMTLLTNATTLGQVAAVPRTPTRASFRRRPKSPNGVAAPSTLCGATECDRRVRGAFFSERGQTSSTA
jgi:hypothetical protein